MLWLLPSSSSSSPSSSSLQLSMSKQSKFRQPELCTLLIGVIIFGAHSTSALRCYTCSYTLNEPHDTCIRDAKATESITDCDMKYCTIMRQESKSPAGKVISFIRDCLDKPLFLNKVVEDETFKSYYRSCQTDLCNDSTGKSTTSSSSAPSNATVENAIIKGRDAASTIRSDAQLLCLIAICVSVVLRSTL